MLSILKARIFSEFPLEEELDTICSVEQGPRNIK